LDEYTRFRDALVAAGHLLPTGIDGVFGRSGDFEAIVDGINNVISLAGADLHARTVAFGPIVPRATLEHTDYVTSFPNLIGAVHSFSGGDREHRHLLDTVESGGDWAAELEPTDLALCAAACHPLYPLMSGPLPGGQQHYTLLGWIFRHEPSIDPARMQTFRQREYIYLGDPEGAEAFRDLWIERGLALLSSLGLAVDAVIANDPFFGRTGRMLSAGQREDALKYELVSPICSADEPTAIASSNCHRDHFGATFHITTADGNPAHTACVGFGLERITLALLHTHGLDAAQWPPEIRERLWP
jgi:seryl-tRNA synthetase